MPSHPALPKGAVAALSVASFGSGMSMRVNDPLLPHLAEVFSVGLSEVALVVSLFSVAYGTALLVIGPLGEKYGKYRVVTVGTLLCAVTAALCGLAWDFPSLLVARVAAGLTAGAIIPLSMAWIGDVIDYEHRQSVLAKFLIGMILGTSFGAWVGGLAADLNAWRLPFFGAALLFGGAGAALWTRLVQLPAHALVADPALRMRPAAMAGQMGSVLRLRWVRTVLVFVALEGAAVYGAVAFIATHLHERLSLSLSSAGSLVMLFGFGGFAFAVGSRRLVATLRERGLVRWGGLMMVVALALVAWSPWAAASAVACFVLGAGFYMLHNTLQVHATQMAPERRSVAVALFAAAFFLGQAAGVQAVGLAAVRWGLPPLITGCALVLLVLSLALVQALVGRERAEGSGARPPVGG